MNKETGNQFVSSTALSWLHYACVFLLVFFSNAYFFQGASSPENAAIGQLKATTESAKASLSGMHIRSSDVVFHSGEIYAASSTGLFYASLLQWKLARHVVQFFAIEEAVQDYYTAYATRVLSVGFASAILAVMLLYLLATLLKNKQQAIFLTLSYSFGSLAFPYATLFASQQLAACLLFASFTIAFLLGQQPQQNSSTPGVSWPSSLVHARPGTLATVAGFLAGFSVCSHHIALVGLFVISSYFLLQPLALRSKLAFCSGGCIGFLPHIFYVWELYGKLLYAPQLQSALICSSGCNMAADTAASFHLPSWLTIQAALFSDRYGLFVWSPWLLLLLATPFSFFLLRSYSRELLSCMLIVAGTFFVAVSFTDQPTLTETKPFSALAQLVPALPFATVLVAALTRMKIVRIYLYPATIWSIVCMLFVTSVSAQPAYQESGTLWWYGQQFLHGNYSLDATEIFTRNPTRLTDNSVAFNPGKLLQLPGPVQLLPLLAVWSLLSTMLFTLLKGSELSNRAVDFSARRNFLQTRLFAPSISISFCAFLVAIPVCHSFSNQLAGHFDNSWLVSLQERLPGIPNATDSQKAITILTAARAPYFIATDIQERAVPMTASYKAYLQVQQTGTYNFYLETGKGNSGELRIDGDLLPLEDGRTSLNLNRGSHQIEINLIVSNRSDFFKLFWAPPGQPLHIVPGHAVTLAP